MPTESTQDISSGGVQLPLIRRRMTHAQAVSAELKRWRFYHDEDATVLAFCACVALKMKGGDMDDVLSPLGAETADLGRGVKA